MAPSPAKGGYAKLSLEEDDDLLDGTGVETEEQRIRKFKNCPSDKKPWPELKSSWCSRLVFGWYAPLIKLGGRVPLEMEDIWQLDPGDQAPPNADRFWGLWQEEIARAEAKSKRTGKDVTPWLGRPLVRLTWRPLLKGAFLRISCDMLSFARPLLMQQILLICEGSPAIVSRDNAWMLAVGMASASFVQMFLNTQYENNINRVAFRVRCAIVGALYRKTISLSSGAKASYSSGKIVNMMGNDAMKCMWMVWQINWAWGIPFNFAMALYLLVQVVGTVAYAGVVLVGVCMPPLMAFWMKQGAKIRKAQMKQTDKRSKEMTEVLTSIRIIKFMSWEERFIDKITKTRNEELRLYRRSQLLNTALSAVFMTIPLMMVALVIGMFGYTGGVITASMAFTTISLMDMVRGPLTSISWILNSVFVDGRTSVDRLSRFMTTDEAVQYVESKPFRADRPAVELRDLTIQHPHAVEAVFDPDEERKSVTAVCCDLCCPKPLNKCYQRVAEWNKTHWSLSCIPLCCKKKDKKSDNKGNGKGGNDKDGKGKGKGDKDKKKGTDGDTDKEVERGPCLIGANLEVQHGSLCCIVGKVGSGKSSLLLSLMGEIDRVSGSVTLSGTLSYAGQTASVLNCTVRENILYGNEYDEERYEKVIFACALVDDIKNLEAGDQTQIGEKGISLSGGQKQRIGLARAVYHEADCYILDDPLSAVDAHTGAHIFKHCIEGLLKDKTVLLPVHNLSYLDRADQVVVLEDKKISEQGQFSELMRAGNAFAKMMKDFSTEEDGDGAERKTKKKGDGEEEPSDTPRVKGDGKMMEAEERERGGVSGDVYIYYLKQAHWCAALLIIFSFVVSQSTGVGQNFWMTRWAVQDPEYIVGYDETWTQNEILAWFLGFYCVAAFINSMSNNVRRLIITLIGLRTSRKLHHRLLVHIMKAPVKFFDVTPVGRIVNRFTSDVGSIDQSVIQQWAGLSDQLMTTIVGLAISSLATPFIWVAAVPVFYVFWNIQQMYRKTARELKRLSSIQRSPIFAHFNETIQTLTTVRAFNQQERLIEKNNSNNDKFGRAMLAQNVCFRWLSIRLNSMSTGLTTLVTTWICLHPDQLDPGLTAMVITYSLQVTGYLQWLINTFTQLEIEMNSIERVKHYSEIDTEASYNAGANGEIVTAPPGWPTRGSIEFNNVCARYRPELPLVLEKVSFTVNSNEKVGVVGRTGSGKSTLMNLLFRIIELESGSICIDGIDIAKLGLKQLRQAISMLPQDPTLFTGTIRENIDPFEQYSDSQVWDALEKAQMKDALSALPEQLDTPVGEGGDAFSVGERQLLCLARSILAEAKLLIMDECTASVDVQTDAKIQEMIRVAFKNCTVFAIAHRLDTIIDYDKIAVLDYGHLKEYGSGAELIDMEGGIFSSLVTETGPTQAPRLRSLARKAAQNKANDASSS